MGRRKTRKNERESPRHRVIYTLSGGKRWEEMSGDFSYLSNESLLAPLTIITREEDAELSATDFVLRTRENPPITELRRYWGRTSF